MKTYKPGQVPDNPANLPGFLRQEHASIQRAAHAADPFLQIQERTSEPVKVSEGLIAWADGATWDPGYGAGLYQYRDGAWVPIGTMGNPRYVTDAQLHKLENIANQQLIQLTKIALLLSRISGVVINDDDIQAQTYQLRQLTKIELILSAMSGAVVSDGETITYL